MRRETVAVARRRMGRRRCGTWKEKRKTEKKGERRVRRGTKEKNRKAQKPQLPEEEQTLTHSLTILGLPTSPSSSPNPNLPASPHPKVKATPSEQRRTVCSLPHAAWITDLSLPIDRGTETL